ncbi:MAG: isoleucine--tRNA ligase [Acidilobus sp.]
MKVSGALASDERSQREIEDWVMSFWDRNGIYQRLKSLRGSRGKLYFLDGPPYASAPSIHLGTAWNKILKDALLRYYRMLGYDVWDKPGYDTHGLPIEILVERKFDVKNKKDIETSIGIERFVNSCLELVKENIKSMTENFKQLGVFMDWENPYVTYSDDYIESGWHLIKVAYEKGLLYRSKRVLHWCPRCETTLADYEVSEYRELEDPSVYVKFKVKGFDNLYLLVWTTTPWTLPANAFVMAHPDMEYAEVDAKGERYIILKDRVDAIMKEAGITDHKILRTFKGSELKDLEYVHPLEDLVPAQQVLKAYHRVVLAPEGVTATEGTGLVHSAPGHGDVDFEVGSRLGVPPLSVVDNQGRLTEDAGKYRGLYFRTEANEAILKDLKERGAIFYLGKVVHRYPVCWRCKTPLVMRTTEQWFIAVSKLRDKLVSELERVEWVPSWAKSRIGSLVSNIEDWVISRQRYWGIPLPIWTCNSCGHVEVVGSVDDIERLGGRRPEHLHRPWIDRVTLRCPKCGGVMTRVPDVADVWFDSGIAFYASLGYPRRREDYERLMPVDLVLEGHDQLRGWFFSLLRSGVIGFESVPYRRVLVHGFVLDEHGREMHKSLGNYVAVEDILKKYPRDVMRLYLLRNTTWEDLRFSWHNVDLTARDFTIMKNVYAFASLYMSLDGFDPKEVAPDSVKDYLEVEDKWLLSRLNSYLKEYREHFDKLEVHEAARIVRDFIVEDISRWYLRLIRRRVWEEKDTPSKRAAYATLYTALRTWILMAAPIMPFISEYLYQNFVRPAEPEAPESVHMNAMPEPDTGLIDDSLEAKMKVVREITEYALSLRMKGGVKLRRPLRTLYVSPSSEDVKKAISELQRLISQAINVKEVKVVGPELMNELRVYELEPEYSVVGPEFKKLTPMIIKALKDDKNAAAEILNKGFYNITVNGQSVRIERRHVKIIASYPDWLLADETPYGTVALDKRVSEEEVLEGIAREIVRRVQYMRKLSNLSVDAYIELWISGDEELVEAARAMENYIKSETRAIAVFYNAPPNNVKASEWEVDEKRLSLAIREVKTGQQ